MDFLHRNTHLLHYINTIFKGEHNSFLGSPNYVLFAMLIEVYALNGATYFLVFQHTFGAVTERQNTETCTSDRSLGGKNIHIAVRDTLGSNGPFHP